MGRHWLIKFTLMLAVLTAGGLLIGPASSSGQTSDEAHYGRALRLIEAGDANQAAALLRQVADAREGPVSHAAALLHGQITGAFAERQRLWRDRKIGNVVMLVEDERSFAEAVGLWDDKTFFPVLLDDGWYARLFIRAFEPAAVVRLTAEQPGKLSPETLRRWLARATPTTPDGGAPPPGLVAIDPNGPHRAAGLALAAGRGQPCLFIDSPGPLNAIADLEQVASLNERVMNAMLDAGLLSMRQHAAITLAADLPYRYRTPGEKGVLAVDDVLGRNDKGTRFAVVGRTLGSPAQAVYQAMSALFLHVDRAMLFDDYSNRDGRAFEQYRFDGATGVLAGHMPVAHVAGEHVSRDSFTTLTRRGEPFDMVWINSSGGQKYWDLRGGRADAEAMPLGWPRAYYVVHSHSLGAAANVDTIGGRALAGGGYWYCGSVHEPYLHGFAPPTGIAVKAASGTPLAFAIRRSVGMPLYKPWKITVIGDPLFTLREAPPLRIDVSPDAWTTDAVVTADSDAVTMNDGQAAVERAIERVTTPDEHTRPGDLAYACYVLDRAGRADVLRQVEAAAAMEHPVARVLVRRAVRAGFLQRVEVEPAAAKDLLARLLVLDNDELLHDIGLWLASMAKRNRDAEAIDWLADVQAELRPKMRLRARRTLKQALEPSHTAP